MPLYDWKCEECGHEFEAVSTMANKRQWCRECNGHDARKKFSPTVNICIPGSFKRDSNWHMPNGERSADSAPYSDNNSVHAPRKQPSFREKFEEAWRKH